MHFKIHATEDAKLSKQVPKENSNDIMATNNK